MHTLTLPRGVIELHDSPRKLPESRRVEFDYYSLIESGIGSSIQDIDRHFEPLMLILGSDDLQAQTNAVNNIRYLFFGLLHKQISPKSLAFAALVETVNGKRWDDYTEEGLQGLVLKLSQMGLTQEIIDEVLPELRKVEAIPLPSEIILYDSAYKLPESRRTEFSYYNLIHSAIGSTLQDYERNFDILEVLVAAKEIDDTLTAINNIRYLFFNILHKQIAPNVLALSCLVRTVNGEQWDDYSPEGLEELARKLSELGVNQECAGGIIPVYEKILKPLQQQFPKQFPDSQKEVNQRLQRALILTLDEIIDPDNATLEHRRKSIESEFVDALKPPLMAGKGSVPDSIHEAYRKNKFLLLTEGLPVDDLTPAITFWSYISDLQDKYRRQSGK
ncbi:hypothetical protein [Spirosoma litoris]